MNTQFDSFTRAYIECALWSSTDNADERGGAPLEDNYTADSLSEEAIARITADCQRFQAENAADIATAQDGRDWTGTEVAGQDFWLSRNGHGAGFFDAYKGDPYPDDAAERLQSAARAFGECHIYVGDDGKLHI